MTDEEAAYHEAGHAIVAMRLGYRCASVSIAVKNEHGDREGACCEDPMKLTHKTAQQRYEDRVAICLAGDLAETRRVHNSDPHYGFDMADIYNAVICHLGSGAPIVDIDAERQRVVSRVRPRTEALIEQHWDEIDHLAHDLLDQKRITFSQS